jgi:hypothetical protein
LFTRHTLGANINATRIGISIDIDGYRLPPAGQPVLGSSARVFVFPDSNFSQAWNFSNASQTMSILDMEIARENSSRDVIAQFAECMEKEASETVSARKAAWCKLHTL